MPKKYISCNFGRGAGGRGAVVLDAVMHALKKIYIDTICGNKKKELQTTF